MACGCGMIAKSLECLFIPLKVNLASDHRTLHWFALLVVSSPQACFLIQGDALDCDAWGSEKLTIFPVRNNSLVSVWSCVPVLGGDEVEGNDRSSGEDRHCTWVISVYSEGNNHFPSVREAFELQKKKCWVWLAGKPMALLGSGPACSAGRAHSRLKVLRLDWCPNPSTWVLPGYRWLVWALCHPLLGVFAGVTLVNSMEFPWH